MIAAELVNALLEADEVDPKSVALATPGIHDDAIAFATEKLETAYFDGLVRSPREADEKAAEFAQDALVEFGLNEIDDYDTIVTPVFKLAAEMFPEGWDSRPMTPEEAARRERERLQHPDTGWED